MPAGAQGTLELEDGRKVHFNVPSPGMVRVEQVNGRTEDMTREEWVARSREPLM